MQVILFDGVCNLCNGVVQFILTHDKHNNFQFASLQSPYGISLQKHFGLRVTDEPESILVYDGSCILSRSAAVMKIFSGLGGIYNFFTLFKILPRFLLDGIYNWFARNRYSIFGKTASCYLPDKDISHKFLDNILFDSNAFE
jgi:predicted DCC family thiol-disulfide oxidoreductase YuxK